MPQLDVVLFAPLLNSLLLLTALLLPLVSELLLLALLGFRARRLLGSSVLDGREATALDYSGAARSQHPYPYYIGWRPLRNYRRVLALLLRPYDATTATPVATPAPAYGAAL
jgi:hypothetical protein